jgi:hypothetical protein
MVDARLATPTSQTGSGDVPRLAEARDGSGDGWESHGDRGYRWRPGAGRRWLDAGAGRDAALPARHEAPLALTAEGRHEALLYGDELGDADWALEMALARQRGEEAYNATAAAHVFADRVAP